MPFTDTPDPITASLTDLGRMNFARVAHGEISFEVTGFAVGQGGYNMANPVQITALDPTQTQLTAQYFPTSPTIQPIEDVEYPTPKTAVISCRLGPTDSITALGELGIWATIIHSNTTPAEVGTTFLMAIVHFPIMTKTFKQVIVYRVIVQF